MPYRCDHISSLWYPMYCGICEDVTPEWYEDEGKYLPKECYLCPPEDAQYEDNFDDELWHNHESCTKYLNGLYCVHGCPKHSYFVGPIVRNGPLQWGQSSDSAGIFLNCPSCNNISAPTPKYVWNNNDLKMYRHEGREISEILEEMPGWEGNRGTSCDIEGDRTLAISNSRCGLCGYKIRPGHFDVFIAPFQIVLSCDNTECMNMDSEGNPQPNATFLDLFDNHLDNVIEIGYSNHRIYYKTPCNHDSYGCGNMLTFSSDIDILDIRTEYFEVRDSYFPSDAITDGGDLYPMEDYEPLENWGDDPDYSTNDDEYRRSTTIIKEIPKTLQQVFTLPVFETRSRDFNKSNFIKE